MKNKDALKLLKTAPTHPVNYSNVVSNYTEKEFTNMVTAMVKSHAKHSGKMTLLPASLIKQVWQAVKNMPHPRYNKAI